jgi:hypothetical protein
VSKWTTFAPVLLSRNAAVPAMTRFQNRRQSRSITPHFAGREYEYSRPSVTDVGVSSQEKEEWDIRGNAQRLRIMNTPG